MIMDYSSFFPHLVILLVLKESALLYTSPDSWMCWYFDKQQYSIRIISETQSPRFWGITDAGAHVVKPIDLESGPSVCGWPDAPGQSGPGNASCRIVRKAGAVFLVAFDKLNGWSVTFRPLGLFWTAFETEKNS